MDSKEPVAHQASTPLSQPSEPPAWAVSTQFSAMDQVRAPGGKAVSASPFDVCHVGVVLRVVLGVQGVVLLGASFGSQGLTDALARWMQASAVALPGSLLWLLVACAARRWLERRREVTQNGLVVALGGVAGVVGTVQGSWLDWALGVSRVQAWSFVPPVLAGAALAGVTAAWLRHRARSVMPAQSAARLAELQARIRPHFLFNTLNTAIALVQIDPQRAESVLEDLAELFRHALSTPGSRWTLAEEVDLARRYLSIEQLRFGERVAVRWELDPRADTAQLPALILQPLVENAIRHGIEPASAPGWVVVSSQLQAGHVVITVRNSVPDQADMGKTAGHGMALRNVRQRLKLMHDVESDFDAGLQRGDGVRQPPVYVVRLTVPQPD